MLPDMIVKPFIRFTKLTCRLFQCEFLAFVFAGGFGCHSQFMVETCMLRGQPDRLPMQLVCFFALDHC